MKVWKLAIVGCGFIAEGTYLPQLQSMKNVSVAALCDPLEDRAKSLAQSYGVEKWYTDLDTLLEDCDFDILMDLTPIKLHHDINIKALNAGKHVYTQKPAALTAEEVTGQILVAKQKGLKISASPIHMIRPEIREIKRLLDEGAIGKVSLIKSTCAHGGPEYFQYRDADPTWFFKPDAGALVDMGVHVLHVVTGLIGPAKRVSCMAAVSEKNRTVRTGKYDGMQIKSDEIADNYLISLDFGDGTLCAVDTSFVQKASRIPPLSVEIYGDSGTISLGYGETGKSWPHFEIFMDSREKGLRGWSVPMIPEQEFVQAMAVQDLIYAIENDTRPVLSLEHARHVVEIMSTAAMAAAQNRVLDLNTEF